MASEQEPRVTTTKTPGGWKIEMDNDTWVLLMSALTSAITLEVHDGRAEGEQAKRWAALRTALDHMDKSEGF